MNEFGRVTRNRKSPCGKPFERSSQMHNIAYRVRSQLTIFKTACILRKQRMMSLTKKYALTFIYFQTKFMTRV